MPLFDAEQLRGQTFARHIEIHETLGSTNDRAAELALARDVELPALVIARRQSAGRGRGKNVWQSAEGALTFSLLLEPATLGIDTANWPPLSLAAAVAVCDALQSVGWAPPTNAASSTHTTVGSAHPTLGIKWPNDVLLTGRKICGILLESPAGTAPAKDRLILGIGINVNNSCQASPDDAVARTALCDVTGKPHSLQEVLIAVVRSVHVRLEQLAAGDRRLPAAWQRLCIFKNQQVAMLIDGVERARGICLGIDADGALLLRDSAGQHRFHSGSLRPLA